MNWIRNNWPFMAGVFFVALAFLVCLFGDMIDPRQKLTIIIFMTLFIHQFEEYVCPGGFPLIWNRAVSGEEENYTHYPLNKNNALFSNVSFWIIYALIILFGYEIPVLLLMLSYIGFGQVFMHAFMMNIKAHTKYSPGMATAILIMLPVGIYSMWFLAVNYTVPFWSWFVAIILLMLSSGLLLALPMKIMGDRNSPYRYAEEDLDRFHLIEKMGVFKKD